MRPTNSTSKKCRFLTRPGSTGAASRETQAKSKRRAKRDKRRGMHAASLEGSARLRNLLDVLSDAGRRGATSLDLIYGTWSPAIGTNVSELRRQLEPSGRTVTCTREPRTGGGFVFRYRIARLGEVAA